MCTLGSIAEHHAQYGDYKAERNLDAKNAAATLYHSLREAANHRDDFLVQLRVDPLLDINGMLIDGCMFTVEKVITLI